MQFNVLRKGEFSDSSLHHALESENFRYFRYFTENSRWVPLFVYLEYKQISGLGQTRAKLYTLFLTRAKLYTLSGSYGLLTLFRTESHEVMGFVRIF